MLHSIKQRNRDGNNKCIKETSYRIRKRYFGFEASFLPSTLYTIRCNTMKRDREQRLENFKHQTNLLHRSYLKGSEAWPVLSLIKPSRQKTANTIYFKYIFCNITKILFFNFFVLFIHNKAS